MNPRQEEESPVVPDPHPCSLNTNTIRQDDLKKDYEDLVNCCQRHVCRKDGYCKSSKKQGCRFNYPFPLEQKSRIIFTEVNKTIKATIALKRNDQYSNMHRPFMLHHWRGNIDLQIILDKQAAVNYMVKYATKGEKAGKNFTNKYLFIIKSNCFYIEGRALVQIYRDVIGSASNDDNSNSKLRSLMIRQISGNRDIGQCEISRLINSDPMYTSTFTYITISTDLDSKQLHLNKNLDSHESAFKKTLIDFYANRKSEVFFKYYSDHLNMNLLTFVRKFTLDKKNELIIRPNSEKTVIITYPKFRANPDNKEMYKNYCLHQLIKLSVWDKNDYEHIRNLDNAVERWLNFLTLAPKEILDMISYNTELAKQLKEARKENDPSIEPMSFRDNWMILSEISPSNSNEEFFDDVVPDLNYDWIAHRSKYTEEELNNIENGFIKFHKQLMGDNDEDDKIPVVLPGQLNEKQLLAYKIVKNASDKQQQLLMIVNGTAGTGKSFLAYCISNFLNGCIKRCAPTAKAAFLILGSTIHSLFNVNTKIDKQTYPKLSDDQKARLQNNFKDITHVIIDEYSMLSQVLFAVIEHRLREATGIQAPFGGLSIILIGDPG